MRKISCFFTRYVSLDRINFNKLMRAERLKNALNIVLLFQIHGRDFYLNMFFNSTLSHTNIPEAPINYSEFH